MPDVPPEIKVQSGHSRVFMFVGLTVAIAGAVLLFLFNPAQNGFYPRCFFRMATGWDCPGCGGLRATHQLLHGHWRAAFELNPLFILALPAGVYFAARWAVKRFAGKTWPHPFKSGVWMWIAVVAVVVFGVLRNLPWRSWLGG
jgi:hypothetical protein